MFGGLFKNLAPKKEKEAATEKTTNYLPRAGDSFFDVCHSRMKEAEGGYVNHPKDPGGETNHGITKAVAVKNGYSGPMIDLSADKAKEIYKSQYWDQTKCADFPRAAAFQFFDACVNHGPQNAAKILQRSLGLNADGIIGPVTMDAVLRKDPSEFCALFNAERLKFYTDLKTFSDFGRGWSRRIVANLRFGVEDARSDHGS